MSDSARSMRRRMRLRVLLAGAVLPLALWAALPVFSQGAASPTGRLNDIQRKIRVTQGKIGKRKGTERLLTTQISAYSERIGRLQGRIGTLQSQQANAQADLDAKRNELLQDPARPARRAPPPRAPARPPGPGPHGARPAAGRALPGRQARHRHRDHVLQGLRRAARARRVHAARVRAGPEHHQDRAQRQVRRDGHRQAPGHPRDAASRSSPRSSSSAATRSPAPSRASSTRRSGSPGRAPTRPHALGTVRAERQQLEGNLSGLKAEQSKIQATLQQSQGTLPAGPIKQGNGSLIWPVNGPDHLAVLRAPGLGGLPPGHRHRRPHGHADPRGRRGHGRPHAVGRRLGRLRQLHLHPAHRRDVDVLRAPVALRHLAGRQRQPGPGHRLHAAAPGCASARTCTSRCASTARSPTRSTTSETSVQPGPQAAAATLGTLGP